MHDITGRRSASRWATRGALLLALVVASIALTHCRMVADRLTGVEVAPFKRSKECIENCRERFEDQQEAERHLHKLLVKNCDEDPICLKQEGQRHEEAMKAITRARRDCVAGCHHQGGGRGGDD